MKKNLLPLLPFINIFAFVLLSASFFTGCSTSSIGIQNDQSTMQSTIIPKMDVVTSFYPLYEIAKQVGGEYVSVKNLVPPGAEPHDYELTPKDIAAVSEAQILFVNGVGLEPWLDKVVPQLNTRKVTVLNASKSFSNLVSGDPHIWLDPIQYIEEVKAFENAIVAVDPAHREYYQEQAKNYVTQLQNLNQSYVQGLINCSTHEFVTNHAAFGYLAKRYNLAMIPIAGLSPDAEPSPKVLADLTDLLKQKAVKYILVETLVSPKIAQTLAQEVGAQTLVFNPLEGLTDEDLQQGENYVTVMQKNLQNLQIAMNCR